MARYILIGSIIFLMLVGAATAGPFGLSMGMKESDFKDQLKQISLYKYQLDNVPIKHSYFNSYVIKFGPKCGLYYIKAIGKDISTDSYGYELKSSFDHIEIKLKKTYGLNSKHDKYFKISSSSEPKDWMLELTNRERILAALWSKTGGSKLKDNLKAIGLIANGKSRLSGYLTIEYSFINYDICEAEISKDDEAL